MLVQAVGVVNVWLPGRCRWLGIFWCKTICSFDFDMVLSHLPLWLLCSIGSDLLKVVNVGLLGADGLAYSDARPSAALSLMWCKLFAAFVINTVWSDLLWLLVFDSLSGADGLAYSDARPCATRILMWYQAIYSLWMLSAQLWSGLLRCVTVWWPGWCRWLGIFISDTMPSGGLSLMWCQAIYSLSLFNML